MLYETVKQEMLTNLARQLDYSPKAEEIPIVAKVMCADLTRIGINDADSERVRTAFQRIAVEVGRWPTAYMIKEYMPQKPALPYKRNVPRTNNAVNRAFGKKLTEVNAFVAKYQKQHPGTSKKDACFAYMEETGIHMPKPLQETEAQREARLEREAIQQE